MHVTFVQAFAVAWAIVSLTAFVVGMKLACKSTDPKPRHIREAEAIVERCWRE